MNSVSYGGSMNDSTKIVKCTVQPGDKPAIAKPLFPREQKAYEDLQQTPLKDFLPQVYGTDKHDDKEYLISADLTSGIEDLCFADLKLGTRCYDADATDVKRNKVLKKQDGTTTETLGVRLDKARIVSNGEVVQSWDKYSGLSFNYDQLQEVFYKFVPENLREAFATKVGQIYDAFSATLEQFPAFRMYKPTLLVVYDGKKKDDIHAFFINLKHTHIDISVLECDPDDDDYDDGIFQGLSTLMNFAEFEANGSPEEKGQLDIKVTETDNDDKIPGITRCVVQPGDHHCIMRNPDPNESSAYTIFMPTPISKHMPKLYGIQNKQVIVEDINYAFKTPCIADFKVGVKTFDIDDQIDIKKEKQTVDNSTTTSRYFVRLSMAVKSKNGKVQNKWSANSGEVNLNESNLMKMVHQYCEDEDVRKKIAEQLNVLKEAYEDTLLEYPNLRMYNTSILVCYDGDDKKQAPRCVFSKLGSSHLDIGDEGYSTGPENDDEFRNGIINLIKYFSLEVGEKAAAATGSASKCCLLI